MPSVYKFDGTLNEIYLRVKKCVLLGFICSAQQIHLAFAEIEKETQSILCPSCKKQRHRSPHFALGVSRLKSCFRVSRGSWSADLEARPSPRWCKTAYEKCMDTTLSEKFPYFSDWSSRFRDMAHILTGPPSEFQVGEIIFYPIPPQTSRLTSQANFSHTWAIADVCF